METPLFRTREDIWNAVFMLVFLIFVFALSALVDRVVFASLSIFDVGVLIAATFRLIRLFSYDKITSFIRDYLEDSSDSFQKTLFELMICPWCTGVWVALFSTALYLLFPGSWFFFVVLAISWVASFFQIVANSFIRYSEKSIAEKRKIEEDTLQMAAADVK